MKRKIKLILCDEKRNPHSEIIPYYGSHNSSKRILIQTRWREESKKRIWTSIVEQKITNQAKLLKSLNKGDYKKLFYYVEQIQYNDSTNREGHAAKVYFNSLFGIEFNRNIESNINAALDYGYSIILSTFNKEIVSNGYLTQLGINHRNEYNHYNFACDLMEPFRILVDEVVYKNNNKEFDINYRMRLVDLLNKKVKIDGKKQYLSNAIKIYTRSVLVALEKNKFDKLLQFIWHEV